MSSTVSGMRGEGVGARPGQNEQLMWAGAFALLLAASGSAWGAFALQTLRSELLRYQRAAASRLSLPCQQVVVPRLAFGSLPPRAKGVLLSTADPPAGL